MLTEHHQSDLLRGSIQKLEIFSAIFDMARRIQIYLPPSYHEQPTQHYSVLYMHYGQYIFDAPKHNGESWQVHRVIEQLLDADQIEEFIVVGIVAERETAQSDYSHYTPALPGGQLGGISYESFILQELKPFIDKTYRTLRDYTNTVMIGACQGAVATYNMAERHPTVFGKIGLISPSVYSWKAREWLYPTPIPKYEGLVWLGSGNSEGDYTTESRLLLDTLLGQGFRPGVDIFYTSIPDAGHNDMAWGAQMYHPLLLFFGKSATADREEPSGPYNHLGTPLTLTFEQETRVGIHCQPLVTNPTIHYDSSNSRNQR
ncbi:MAG: alpha/beta hydrolase-fold protein [Chloroflexota bacterium]